MYKYAGLNDGINFSPHHRNLDSVCIRLAALAMGGGVSAGVRPWGRLACARCHSGGVACVCYAAWVLPCQQRMSHPGVSGKP
jgi:hypothetical protein